MVVWIPVACAAWIWLSPSRLGAQIGAGRVQRRLERADVHQPLYAGLAARIDDLAWQLDMIALEGFLA